MHPKTRLILVATVVGLLVVVPVLAIALGVGLGVGLQDSGSNDASAQVDPLVVQATSITFGALTPVGRGAVRLSARDSNAFAAPFRGLGLLPKTSLLPAFWRVTPAMDNVSASHWTFPSDLVVEGINATTPVPSAAGNAAGLNRGPYRFLIEAFTKDMKPYRSANLTIAIQQGAMSYGTYDSASQYLPRSAAWSSFTGDTVLLSTGIDKSNQTSFFNGLIFAKRVTFKHADPSRPGGIMHISFSNSSNVLVTGLSFTGNLSLFTNAPGVVYFGGGSSNMALRSCNATFDFPSAGTSAAIQFAGCINCEVTDYYVFGMDTGVYDKQNTLNVNITITRFRMRQFWNNAIWVGNARNLTFIDCVTMAGLRFTNLHLDHIQVADGSTPQGLSVIRHQMYQAEGNAGTQGFFGGTPGIYEGYIDDNSTFGGYSGLEGNVLTITAATLNKPLVQYTSLRGANFSQLIQVVAVSQPGVIGQYVIDKSLKAPPGQIHSAPFNDLTINGLAYTGWMRDVLYLRGVGGKSTIRAYTASMVNQLLSEVVWTYFKGTIVGTTLNVTEFLSGAPMANPMLIELADGTPLNASAPGPRIVGPISPGDGHEGTYSLDRTGFNFPSLISMRATADLPALPNNGPACDIMGVDLPALYSGQTTISSLYMWTSFRGMPSSRGYVGGTVAQPPSITIDSASTLFNTANSTVSSMSFAQGDPQLGPRGLQQLNHTEWAKLSFDEVLARHVAALTPRVGGPLTSGTMDMGAFTRNGRWNDGSGKRPY